ncbi:MAG: acylneuraminate cytidylyltransferase family protein [Coriobacteriia bacterium]
MSATHVALIPARGGSKGVPRKNLRVVGGSPLVVHTIRAALTSAVFDVVSVSTDDDEIAAVAVSAGAIVVRRPADLASDSTLTEPVMQHALGALERDSAPFDVVWLLQPTSPLRSAEDIVQGAALIAREDVDAVVSVCEDHSFIWVPSDGSLATVQPTYDLAARPRRQDMPPRYRENGALYAIKRHLWDAQGVRAAGRVAPLVMPADRSTDVDSEADLVLVDAILRSRSDC